MDISIIGLILVATTGGPDNQIQELRDLVNELREEVAELRTNQETGWVDEQRAIEIRGLVGDVLTDADARLNLQGSGALSGYNKGAFLTSADGNWKVKINGQIQARWLQNEATGLPDNRGTELRRTKVKFSGHVLDPTWTYKISTTWGRGGGSDTEDAWIGKSLDNGKWFKFGQFKSGFLREHIVSSAKQMGVERSMLNNAFTYGWTQGFELGIQNDDMKLYAQYNDGPGNSNTQALDDAFDAWIVRAEFRSGDASWKDLGYLTSKNGSSEGMLLGVAYQTYENDGGEVEFGNVEAEKSSGWTVDVTMRGDGWNVLGYLVDTTGERTDGTEIDSSGWLLQGGMMVNDNTELFIQRQAGEIEGGGNMSCLRVGFNYWPIAGSNNLKWTTDFAWAGDTIEDGGVGVSPDWAGSNGGNGWRADTGSNDDQTLLRTQLQLLF